MPAEIDEFYQYQSNQDHIDHKRGMTNTAEVISSVMRTSRIPLRKDDIMVVRCKSCESAKSAWGKLFTELHCGFTLDPVRNVGKGPIPLGEYSFRRWMSPRLGKSLRLERAPGFTNILIHVSARVTDTTGCIVVGKDIADLSEPSALLDSRPLTDWLYDTFEEGRVIFR